MKINSLVKYSIRFLTLQFVLTYLTIYYFDNFLVPSNDYRLQIDANLIEDKERFYPFIAEEFIKIDIFISLFIFAFLVFLYSTKFYTYVNELSFSLDKNFYDEYFSIFLTWTTSLIIFVTFFRFSNLVSRGYLLLYMLIVPFILLFFRNTELISSIFGRSVTNEKYITFNLEDDSIFKNLRIMTFRKKINSLHLKNINNAKEIIDNIDKVNKKQNINLIVLNFGEKNKINEKIEDYLIQLNKKVLIISRNEMQFNKLFLSRKVNLSGYTLVYFNNDIQYGSKYILKRITDIILSILLTIIFLPVFILISLYIFYLDKTPIIIKQDRVGLHGKIFKMYKFRTMKNNSHKERDKLKDMSKKSGPLFKISDDPRLIKGTKFMRNYSIDELPQFFNIIKGEMSLVGPRPLFKEDTELFEKKYMRRLNVLPGLTGLLQINERNTDEFSTWYKYDIEYIDNWSLFLDIKIILKTPFALFSSKIKGQ
tara:strand:- start:785 stop:2224 length:1440 start_codon:yes stop_codon:yes gene_type:complete